jgi:glycosyltransferase involved in cell wall biosynthesis
MLMVSPMAPWPATTGGLVRISGLLTQLAGHFDLTFVSPRRADQIVPGDLPARVICPALPDPGLSRKAAALLDPTRPYHVALHSRRRVARIIRRELAEHRYDLVYSHFIYGLQYFAGSRVPVIVDQQNVDRMYWKNRSQHSRFPVKLFTEWNSRKTVGFETRVLPRVWAYVSVSDEDRERTRAYAEPHVRHFWVAPNGVDTCRFRPRPRRESIRTVTLGYLGSMDLHMNVDAVERFCSVLLPRIRQELNDLDVEFLVIGRAPSASIRSLARATSRMTLSGTVPDVLPWLHRVDILVCPLHVGAGTKLKVAEAMSCALPVVGSSLALAGLPGRSREHYIRVEDDESFVDAVCWLARSPEARAAVGQKARELATRSLDWRTIGRQLVDDIEAALAGGLNIGRA